MVENIFKKYDKDNSGELDRKETMKIVNDVFKTEGKRPPTHSSFNQIFKEFDENGDGVLDVKEMQKFVMKFLNTLEDQAEIDELVD